MKLCECTEGALEVDVELPMLPPLPDGATTYIDAETGEILPNEVIPGEQ